MKPLSFSAWQLYALRSGAATTSFSKIFRAKLVRFGRNLGKIWAQV